MDWYLFAFIVISGLGSAISSGLEALIIASNIYDFSKFSLKDEVFRKIERVIYAKGFFIVFLLFSNTFFNVLFSISTFFIFLNVSDFWAGVISVVIVTPTLFVFSEVLPKVFARAHKEQLLLRFLWVLYPISFLSIPFINRSNSDGVLSSVIETLEDELDDESFTKFYSDIIKRLSLIQDIKVREIMTPISFFPFEEETKKVRDILRQDFKNKTILLYRENLTNIRGYVYLGDLIDKKVHSKPLSSIIRTDYISVFTFTALEELFSLLRSSSALPRLVLAFEPSGVPVGVVEMGKISEYIFSYIFAESGRYLVKNLGRNRFVFKADTPIRLVLENFGLEGFEEELGVSEFDTLAEVFLKILRKFPKKGDRIKFSSISLEAVKVENNRLVEIEVSL